MFWKTHHIHFSTYEAGMLQSRAHRALSAFMTTALEPCRLTMPEWALLGAIAESQGMALKALAQTLGVKPPVAHELVTGLCRRGLVSRRPAQLDQRVTLISLTPTGQHLVTEVEAKLRRDLRGYLADIPVSKLLVYIDVLRTLSNKL